MNINIFTVFVMVLIAKKANSLECYVCRGCSEVTSDDLQTCNPRVTEVTTLEPTTDTDMSDVNQSLEDINVVELPLLEEVEPEIEAHPSFVLDTSDLPGAEKMFLRALKQFIDEEDEARCMVTTYEEDGTTNVVRECAYASSDEESTCIAAIGDDFNGSVLDCYICDEDYCNSASKAVIGSLVLVASLAVRFF